MKLNSTWSEEVRVQIWKAELQKDILHAQISYSCLQNWNPSTGIFQHWIRQVQNLGECIFGSISSMEKWFLSFIKSGQCTVSEWANGAIDNCNRRVSCISQHTVSNCRNVLTFHTLFSLMTLPSRGIPYCSTAKQTTMSPVRQQQWTDIQCHLLHIHHFPTHHLWSESNHNGKAVMLLFVGGFTSQPHATVSQGPICSDSVHAATQRQKLQIKLFTSPSHCILTPDQPVSIMPDAWQGSHWSANF